MILAPAGDVGIPELRQLADELVIAWCEGDLQHELDLSRVGHLDYRGLPPIIAVSRAVRRSGGTFTISRPSPYVARILHATGAAEALGLEAAA